MLRPGNIGLRHGVVATPLGMVDGGDDGNCQEWRCVLCVTYVETVCDRKGFVKSCSRDDLSWYVGNHCVLGYRLVS